MAAGRLHRKPMSSLVAVLTVGTGLGANAAVFSFLYGWLQDVRYSFRTLRRRPLFAAVTVLTLGMGIGLATAMFSVVDGVLLKGLPYRDHGRLVTVWQVVPRWRQVINLTDYWDKGWLSFDQYRTWMASGNRSTDLAIHDGQGMTLIGGGQAERLAVGEASSSLLRVLGVQAALGRWFLPDEEGAEGRQSSPVVVLSHELWQRKFGGDRGVIGTTLRSTERSYTIVGIMPSGFRLRMLTVKDDDGKRDLWVPLDADQGYHWEAIGRLAPDVSIEQAEAAMRSVLVPVETASGNRVRLVPRKESEILGFGTPIILLLSATGLILLIACANVAMLSMAEVLGRRQEIATRLALGASRRRIARQLITESGVLGALGGAFGVALALYGTRILVALAPPVPRIGEVGTDVRALGFAAVAGLLSGLLFGTVPALVCTRGGVGATRGSTTRRDTFSQSLIVAELALTVVILVGGGLLARSLTALMDVDSGFNTARLVAVHALLPRSSDAAETALSENMRERILAVPGVEGVASANGVPFFDGASSYQIQPDGGDGSLGVSESALEYRVSPGYFAVMGIPLLAGSGISEAHGPRGPLIAVVSAAMAQRCWPDGLPIGGRFRSLGRTITVVGVAGDVRHQTLDRDPVSTFYVPIAQHALGGDTNFVVRTALEPRRAIPLIREAVWSVNPDVPVTKAGAMNDLVARSAAYRRYSTLLMGVFGIAAVWLAAAGIFGVTARDIAQRAREMGIRKALGATDIALIGWTVRAGLTTGFAGAGIGLVAAVWSSRLLSHFLFGVARTDPLTYGTVGGLVLLVVLVARYVPARRLIKFDPARVLKAE